MIIDTSQGNVEVIGDVKEFKTSIDPKNLEFITTLLSSNLYSNPEESFIREIVSNAWDSHVEAGNTDVPVIIKFKSESYNHSITIRDYGTGISPERFREIYCNIGSSTKRNSNDFIGGFGIGKYSALACSNTTYITSYYNGTAYYYVMIKNGNAITTNLLMEKPTEEKNGVEVTIKNITYLNPYNKSLKNIIFFPNIFIDCNTNNNDVFDINHSKIKRFNNFAVASIQLDSKLLLGNVLYPCQYSHFSKDIQDFLRSIADTGIVIKFDVGEVNITPNRENIIYSTDTIKKIESRIKEAKEELEALISDKVGKNYNNIREYYNAVVANAYYNPITDELTNNEGYRITKSLLDKISFTYKNIDVRSENDNIRNAYSATLPNYRGIIQGDKIHIKRVPWGYRDNGTILGEKILILNENARLINAAKLYLRDNYEGYGIMSMIQKDNFVSHMIKPLKIKDVTAETKLVLEGIYEDLTSKAKYLDLNTDSDFIEYKESLKEDNINNKIKILDPILYVYNKYGMKNKHKFKNLQDILQYIKSLKRGIILTDMSSDDNVFSEIASLKNYVYIKARKDIVKAIYDLKPSYLIDPNYLVNKDPTLNKVSAVVKHFPNGMPERFVYIINSVPKELQEPFYNINRIYNNFGTNYVYRGIAKRVEPDDYINSLCEKLLEYSEKYNNARELVKHTGESSELLTMAVIIKNKYYRVSKNTYNKFANNEIVKILCKR